MSRVFVAEDAALGRKIVIKVLAYIDVVNRRHDVAIDRLEEALGLPTGQYISRPLLRADSSWAPLRRNPRFERLIGGG